MRITDAQIHQWRMRGYQFENRADQTVLDRALDALVAERSRADYYGTNSTALARLANQKGIPPEEVGQAIYEAHSAARITGKGRAVIESGLTLRQAHEIETGCSSENLCARCRKDLGMTGDEKQ